MGEAQNGLGIDFEGALSDEGFRSIGTFDGAFQRPVGAGKGFVFGAHVRHERVQELASPEGRCALRPVTVVGGADVR